MARLRNIKGAREKIGSSRFCIDDPETYRSSWSSVFGNDHPIHIEIGMGKGKFLMKLAALHPDINYIGIEMYSSVLLRAIQKAEEQEANGSCPLNFKFIRMNAEGLEKVFAPGEISKIYLNFSDPWPKDRHAKRRLTSDNFLSLYYGLMDEGTSVEFKTDNVSLFDFSVECANRSSWNVSYVTKDLYADTFEIAENIPTEYEEKFTAQGNKICKMTLIKGENMDLKQKLTEICGAENIRENELLSRHTSFRIGGPAGFFITPENENMLEQVIRVCKEEKIRIFILGNGTNVLAADEGFDGAVIQIYKHFNKCEVNENRIEAGAGILLSTLANAALENSLEGLEFASGIPGSLGGAVTMNAGAYGGEMKQVLTGVRVYSPTEGFKDLTLDELKAGYRDSIIKHTDYIVVSASLELKKGDKAAIRAKMDELKEKRTEKQPLEFPSAGSTFKRPEGYFAGKLIMDAGLKGFSVGGAEVSEKHAGFIINKGGASAKDVTELIEHVRKTVFDKFGVMLEPEVLFLR